ncbi:MAG: prepilin-type N-terminal cleavage/methylation domain-containing protein [Patescibacteria group bacterium]
MKTNNPKIINQSGQTLIEVLVSLSILVMIMGATAIALTNALDNAQYVKNQATATKYAQEGIEIARGIRDANYTQFRNYSGTYCLAKDQTTLGAPSASCTTANVDQFVRSVVVEQTPGCATDVARATITVAWRDGKCSGATYCHTSQHVSCLSTVNPISAP